MLKQLIKQTANAFLGMLINTALTIAVTKTVDVVYKKTKKPICLLCGGKGERLKGGGLYAEMIPCNCRKKKGSFMKLLRRNK